MYRESTTGTFASVEIVEVYDIDPSATGLAEFEVQLSIDLGPLIWNCCGPTIEASTYMRPVDGVEGAFESIHNTQLVWVEGEGSSMWINVRFGTLVQYDSDEFAELKRRFLTQVIAESSP